MRLSPFFSRLLFVLLLGGSLISPAHSGFLSSIARKAADVGEGAGKRLDNVLPDLDTASKLSRNLPEVDGTSRLALIPAENNGWKLVTETGDSIDVSSFDDLSKSLDKIKPSVKKGLAGDAATLVKPGKHSIILREQDFFKLRDKIGFLPEEVSFHLARRGGKPLALKPVGINGKNRFAVDLGDGVMLNPIDAKALEGSVKFMSRGINRGNLKLGSFDSASDAARKAPGVGEMTATLNADLLDSTLARFKNQTLVVSGQVKKSAEGKLSLVVRDGKKLRELDLDNMQKVAATQRVNLIVAQSNSAVQPGKTWFTKTAIEKRFAKASDSISQGELLQALSPPDVTTLVTSASRGDARIVMSNNFAPVKSRVVNASDEVIKPDSDVSILGVLVDDGAGIVIDGIRSNVENPEYTDEVNSRWIPWVSNFGLIAGLVLAAVFSVVVYKLWRWWSAVWRYFGRKFVGHENLSLVAKLFKVITFVPFVFIGYFPAILWICIPGWVKYIFLPSYRKSTA